MKAAVLRVVRAADTRETLVSATSCGCAFRLDVGAEEIGNRIMTLLDHADEVNRVERGGCQAPETVTGSDSGGNDHG